MDASVERFQKEHPIQMEEDEVELISRTIRQSPPNSLMVEWGSGASTIKWLQEMGDAQRLIAIETTNNGFRQCKKYWIIQIAWLANWTTIFVNRVHTGTTDTDSLRRKTP
jgi:predicted O-methyltransferase YrrM